VTAAAKPKDSKIPNREDRNKKHKNRESPTIKSTAI
jgi:hypothetical protein